MAYSRAPAGLREARRSEPTPRSPGLAGGALRGPRPARASAHTGAENFVPSIGGGGSVSTSSANGGRGKWLGSAVSATRLQRTTSRHGGALSDVTNVVATRIGSKGGKQPPPLLEVPAQAAAERAAKVVQPPPRGPAGGPLPPPAPPPAAGSSAASSAATTAPAVVPAPALEAPEVEDEGMHSVAEYVPDIFNHLFHEEANFMPRPTYMDSQTDINGKMRAILVDWLVEVHMKYRLRPETLFLAVNIIDRFCSRVPVARKRLQLVGVVAMLVASKFEEIEPPRINDFVYITDNAYTKEDILQLECKMLSVLGFQIVCPTPTHFFDRLQHANRCDERHRELVQYILELALLEVQMIRHLPSHLVAAALLLSNELLGKRPAWPTHMVVHTRHAEHALRGCAEELRGLLDAAPQGTLQAVRKKYSQERHQCVARMPLVTARREGGL